MNKKNYYILLIALLISFFIFNRVSLAQQTAPADLQKIILGLQKQIESLKLQITEMVVKQAEFARQQETTKGELTAVKSEIKEFKLERTLHKGLSGPDVKDLQIFLIEKGFLPSGLDTGKFLDLTEKAVKKFQKERRLVDSGTPETTGFGQVGQQTFRELISGGAGRSGNIPPGLLIAPGLQNQLPITPTTPAVPATPAMPTTPVSSGGGGSPTSATPATPATPASPSSGGGAPSSLDTTPPVISNIQVSNITTSSSTVTWTTNETATGQLYFSVSPGVNTTSYPLGGDSGTSHMVNISLLSGGKTYYYIVVSTDNSGNKSMSSEKNFATLATGSLAPPSDTISPSTPTNLTATAISTTQINLSWIASTDNVGVVGYKVYRNNALVSTVVYNNRSKDSGNFFSIALSSFINIAYATTTNSTIKSYSDTGLNPNTTYTYNVTAYDAAGNNSAQSASASATTNPSISTVIDAPIIASITPYVPLPLNEHFISSVTLQWNAVTNPSSYLTYYKAWRRLGSGDWLYWTNTQSTTFPDLNLGRGTYYYYVNACYTTTGSPLVLVTDKCSPDSNIMTVTLAGGGGISDTTPPSTPTGLTASIVNLNSPYISWTASTDNVGVAGYNIYRNGTYLMSIIGTTVIDDTVSRSTTTSYTVAAYDAAGNVSVQSNSVSSFSGGTPTISDTTPPSTPTNLTAIANASDTIALAWTASTDNVAVTGYKIYRNGTFLTNTTVATFTNYNDTGLTPSTLYSYTVTAYDAAGNISTQSSSASATIIPVIGKPPAPTNVQAVTSAGSQSDPPQLWYYAIFNYTPQPTIQSFNIYRKRPIDVSFVKYTYSAQTPVNGSILPLPAAGDSNLYHRDNNRWEWWTTITGLSPSALTGEYKFYVTAVDASGVESDPSATVSFKLYAPPTISSPANGSTISSPFSITVDGDPSASGRSWGEIIYKKITGDLVWQAWPAPSTNFTYIGPALNVSDNQHRLVVYFVSGSFDRSLFATSNFSIASVSTTASMINSKSILAGILNSLNALASMLQKFQENLQQNNSITNNANLALVLNNLSETLKQIGFSLR